MKPIVEVWIDRPRLSLIPAADRRAPYRWVVLALGILAQASFSALFLGLGVLAPELRSAWHLQVAQLGLILGAVSGGMIATLLVWGMATDRLGERMVMTLGLLGAGLALALTVQVSRFEGRFGLLMLSGMAGAAVNSAGNRAVASWFPSGQRGIAIGLRQAAIPLGAGLAGLCLPSVSAAHSLAVALEVMAGTLVAVAILVAAGMRDRAHTTTIEAHSLRRFLTQPALARINAASLCFATCHFGLGAFATLQLHQVWDLPPTAAAQIYSLSLGLSVGGRILLGHFADRFGWRRLWRSLGLVTSCMLVLLLAALVVPRNVAVPIAVVTLAATQCASGLGTTAVATTFAGTRVGTALGLQQTATYAAGSLSIFCLGLILSVSFPAAILFLLPLPVLGRYALKTPPTPMHPQA